MVNKKAARLTGGDENPAGGVTASGEDEVALRFFVVVVVVSAGEVDGGGRVAP